MAEFTDIIKVQDLGISDRTLWNNFLSYWKQGNYTQALNVLSNAQLSNKKFVANVLNVISAALSYLEDNWFDNVPNYLSTQLLTFQSAIDEFKNTNDYSAIAQYDVGNFVFYNSKWYMCILKPPVGTLPTSSTYFILLDLKGEVGAYGTGLNLKYSWSNSITYAQYDVVLYNDILYVAKQSSTGKNPATETAYWQTLLTVPHASIYTGTTAPTDPYVGLIWAKQV